MSRRGALLLMTAVVATSCGGNTRGGPAESTSTAGRGPVGSGGFVNYPPIVSCFGKGTRIATATGSIAIENVKIGDRVQAYDLVTDKVVDELVTEVFVHARQPVGELRTATGPLRVTANHPIYDASAGRFVAAGSLSGPFQAIELAATWTTSRELLTGFVPLDEEETVYNLTVANVHTYFAEGLLVHNKSRCGYPGDPPDCPCVDDECGGTSSGATGPGGGNAGSEIDGTGGGTAGSGIGGTGGASTDGGATGELGGGGAGLAGESFAGGAPSRSDAGAGGL